MLRVLLMLLALVSTSSLAGGLATVAVASSNGGQEWSADGVVEAVQQSQLSAQVAGRIIALPVKAGDQVKAGQILVRIDNTAAGQQATASRAQVEAAQAQLAAAKSEYQRQQQLFAKQYISQAALDTAAASYRAAQANANAMIAQAGAAQTQSGFYTITAPYDGVVTSVFIEAGDMAMPGRLLVTVYRPDAMRVSVTLPQELVQRVNKDARAIVLLNGRSIEAGMLTVLPAADPQSHTVTLRLPLPSLTPAPLPGQFARVQLPVSGAAEQGRLYVPASSVVRRNELTLVYVVDAAGKPLLRLVRPGPLRDGLVEIRAGLRAGERVALDPVAAAKLGGE
ncbi:efflux RND transporter periplasmic adaptor subunit [Chitinilyticum aquatile]|uniref:efflux RND transporter periplasmic adaptor subunit n=1 Tax=Chitinilyticum aquatile TaxID=362520 RepID=UPI0005546BAB|nr:efflux RND transporter periplasmic adaptor subunit [Chitinilyticum aquatile]